MNRSNAIEERAARWLLERESGHWHDGRQAALEAWFAEARVNRIAYLRLESGWEQANRLKALGAGFPRGVVPTVEELQGEPRPAAASLITTLRPARARTRPFAAAAALILAIGAGAFLYSADFFDQDRYATAVGAVTSVPLKDGTNVTLNTASRMRVQMTDTVRKVELARGEAFFDVAKDPGRPFIVQAGDRLITVLGTKFSVRRDTQGVRVTVTEGKVAVSSTEGGKGSLVLTPGESVRTADDRVDVQKRSVAKADEGLSWRSGYLVFQETTLADAVAEFNRYNERQIVIADPAVGRMRLTGKFRSTNCEVFARLLQDSFDIDARVDDDRIVLASR